MNAVHEGRVLKRPEQLQMIDSLGTNEQCYHSNLWDKYLRRPCSLHNLTYPDLLTNYRWDHYLHKHVNDDATTAAYPDGSGLEGPKFVLDETPGDGDYAPSLQFHIGTSLRRLMSKASNDTTCNNSY